MNISINNKQWSRLQLSAGFSCLTPQTQGAFYYSRRDLGTDVSNLGKRLDVVSFSRPLGITLTSPTDIWVLSTEEEGILSYETEIVSGAKVIFNNTGGGSTGPSGNYAFNNPLSETGGNVNLNFDTKGLKLQTGRLTLDLTTDPNFITHQNEITNIKQNITTLEAQDVAISNDIQTVKTKIGTATLQTTAKDLSGAINELKAGITQNTLSFSSPLKKTGNIISLPFESDLKVSAGNKLTLDLPNNNDFKNVLTDVTNALKIADFSNVGRVKPLQNHFTINSTNGELSLDLTQTGILSTTFATKAEVLNIDTKVAQNTSDITQLQSDVALKANASDLTTLQTNVTSNTSNITQLQKDVSLKANASDVYTKTETDTLLSSKADSSDLQITQTKVTQNTSNITQLQSDIASKANSNDVYTKAQTDNLLASKANASDLTSLESDVINLKANVTSNTGKLQTLETNYTSLDNQAVKITNTNQNIDGVKKFVKETQTHNLVSSTNGVGYGAVDIRNQDGYFSISKNGQTAPQLLAGIGFVDSTTNFRIRNLAGNIVTFNTLARYEQTLTPADDKDLVPLLSLKQVRTELLGLIQGSQGALTFIGEIAHTKNDVTAQPDLLTQFVNTTESRPPRKGDFIRTSDMYGFIFNGVDWRNFGQTSVSVATTTNAGIVMLGTNDGELQDEGNGKAKVIGWDTVKQELTDLDTRTNTNAQNIAANTQSIASKANSSDIGVLSNLTTTNKANIVSAINEVKSETEANATQIQANTNAIAGKASANDVYTKAQVYTKTETDNLLSSKADASSLTTLQTKVTKNETNITQLKTDIAGKANDSEVVKLTGNQTINGEKTYNAPVVISERLRYKTTNMSISPNTNKSGDIYLSDTSIGSDCYSNLNMGNKGRIKQLPAPQDDSDAVNKLYVDTAIQNSTTTLTFKGALNNSNNTVSLLTETDLKVSAGNKLTLDLPNNNDFKNVLTDVTNALKIADFSNVGRVKPLQNHFTINSTNGELSLDLTQTGILSTTFATKAEVQNIDTKVTQNTSDIASLTQEFQTTKQTIQTELASKVNSNEVYTKQEIDTSLADKSNVTDVQALDTRVTANEGEIATLNTSIASKANIADVYTKQQVDTAVAAKPDTRDVVLLRGNQTINGNKSFTGNMQISTKLRGGYGGAYLLISPEDNSTKTLKFRDTSIGNSNKFNLDLENVCGLTGVKDPTNARDAVPKSYVDNTAVLLSGNQTVNGNKTFTSKIEVQANGEVLKLKNASGNPNLIAGYEGNTRIYYIGKESSSSGDFAIKNEYSTSGWILLKTKTKFDSAYALTEDTQVAHKKYVDDKIQFIPVGGNMPNNTVAGVLYIKEV